MILFILLITALTVGLDQISKLLSIALLKGADDVQIIPGFLRFTYVENKGAAFGMLSEHRWVFMSLSCVALAAIAVYAFWKKPPSFTERFSLGLILGGGIGNMIDRVRFGYVVDFIDFQFIDFYVFNIADAAVCIGCAILFIWMLKDEFLQRKKTGSANGGKE